MKNKFSRFGLILLVAWLALLVFWMVRPTLALPYLSDDFEHGQLIAQIRAGLRPARDLIIVPYQGQTLVLLRLLFWFGTLAGGMNLTWVRLGISAAHVAGAAGCAILCARWTGSKFAGFLAGTLYAGAFGFINEQMWWPSSAIFCLGATFLILAIVALDPEAKNPKLALAISVLMLALAALGLNGILVAALGIPIFLRRREAIVFGAAIAVLLLAALLRHEQEQVSLSLRGIELGGWLILTAPLRFFSGFTTFALPGFQTICKLSPLAWLPLLASAWFMSAHYRRVLLAVWTPAILLAILVGMARADYPWRFGPGSLYTADRYYYFFLFPLVTQCVLFLSAVKLRRFALVALIVLMAAALTASRARYLANVPRNNFEAASRALTQGRLLAQTIRSSAAAQPLTLTDASIPIDGAHRNSLTLAFVIYSEYPRGMPGVRLTDGPIGARDAAIENSILVRWMATPPACVENGLLVPVRAASRIDFQKASYEENLDSGFSWWEAPFRWIGGRASLHLISAPGDLVISAFAPVDQLRRTMHINVEVNDQPAGAFSIATFGVHDYHLQPPTLPRGASADTTLTSDFIWHARDILPQSLDDRDLGIAIFAIGFGDPREPYQSPPCRVSAR